MASLTAIYEKEMEICNLELDMMTRASSIIMVESVSDVFESAINKLKEMIQTVIDYIKKFIKGKEYELKIEEIEKLFEIEPKLKDVKIEIIDYPKIIKTCETYIKTVSSKRVAKYYDIRNYEYIASNMKKNENRYNTTVTLGTFIGDMKRMDSTIKNLENLKNDITLRMFSQSIGKDQLKPDIINRKIRLCQDIINYANSCATKHLQQLSIANKAINEEANKRDIRKAIKSSNH